MITRKISEILEGTIVGHISQDNRQIPLRLYKRDNGIEFILEKYNGENLNGFEAYEIFKGYAKYKFYTNKGNRTKTKVGNNLPKIPQNIRELMLKVIESDQTLTDKIFEYEKTKKEYLPQQAQKLFDEVLLPTLLLTKKEQKDRLAKSYSEISQIHSGGEEARYDWETFE